MAAVRRFAGKGHADSSYAKKELSRVLSALLHPRLWDSIESCISPELHELAHKESVQATIEAIMEAYCKKYQEVIKACSQEMNVATEDEETYNTAAQQHDSLCNPVTEEIWTVGEKVMVQKSDGSSWRNGKVVATFPEATVAQGFSVLAGTVKVQYEDGRYKYIAPDKTRSTLQKQAKVPKKLAPPALRPATKQLLTPSTGLDASCGSNLRERQQISRPRKVSFALKTDRQDETSEGTSSLQCAMEARKWIPSNKVILSPTLESATAREDTAGLKTMIGLQSVDGNREDASSMEAKSTASAELGCETELLPKDVDKENRVTVSI